MRQDGTVRSGLLVAACVAAGALLLSAMLPGIQTFATMLAALACGLAALAAVLAFAAWRRAGENEARVLALARALDQNRDREIAVPPDVDAIAQLVASEVERLAAASAPTLRPSADETAGGLPPAANVEPLIRRAHRQAPGKRAAVDASLADGHFDIALRPVVSLSRGVGAAFDTFAEFAATGEAPFHLARLQADAPQADRARFEALLLACAIDATRRVVAGETDAPLHVPLSRALLETGGDAILERLRAHGRAARSIVVDLSPADLTEAGARPAMLDHLLDAGVGLCVDLVEERTPDLGGLRLAGARQVRLPASRLLGHTASRGHGARGPELAAAAREVGLAVIADGVASDDEALGLADLGIDLMSGPRFAGPRRLRGQDTQASRTAAE